MGAFSNCINLESVQLPDTLESIGLYVFDNCSNLQSIVIPAKIRKINKYTFNGCSNLRIIEFKGRIDSVGENAFKGCKNLQPNGVVGLNDEMKKVILGQIDYTPPYVVDHDDAKLRVEELEIHGGMIDPHEYENAPKLKKLIIPNGVYISDGAFQGCSNLEEIVFDGELVGGDGKPKLTEIGENAFYGCKKLSSSNIKGDVNRQIKNQILNQVKQKAPTTK